MLTSQPKVYVIAILILHVCSNSIAQGEWLKSVCTTNEGEIFTGHVYFNDWEASPSEIIFKDSISQKQFSLSAQRINRLTIYKAKRIEVYSGKSFSYKEYQTMFSIDTNDDPVIGINTLSRLLEIRFESEVVTLYRYLPDKSEPRYYIQKKDFGITELEYVKYTIQNQDRFFVTERQTFRGQLKNLLFECPTLDLKNLRYDEKDFLRILKQYHSYCNIEMPQAKEYRDVSFVQFGIASHSTFPNSEPYAVTGIFRYLLPKRFNNRFIGIEYGFQDYGIYAGTYIGKKKILPLIYFGFSTQYGAPDIGFGLSFKKRFDISIHTNFVYTIISDTYGLGYSIRIYPFQIKF